MVQKDDLQTNRTDDVLKEKQAKEMEEREMFCSNGHRHEQLRLWFHLLANRWDIASIPEVFRSPKLARNYG
jgi:hypothetical protein